MKRHRVLMLVLLLALGVVVGIGVRGGSDCAPLPSPDPGRPRPSVILLTVDTLRPDHLGLYGYPKPTSPSLDRFASQAAVFDQAVASSAWTSPGLVSLLTGLFAARHGVTGPAESVAAGTPTFATLLARAGYRVPNLVYLTSIPNYANLGFGAPDKQYFGDETGAGELGRWIQQAPEEPFFLWYHYRYVHLPYQPSAEAMRLFWPEGVDRSKPESPGLRAVRDDAIVPRDSLAFDLPGDRERVTALYDGEVRTMDTWLGTVLGQLASSGLLDRSVVAVSADHGEELFDHGWVGHASTSLHASLHEELVRVPLMIRFPGGAGGGCHIHDPVRQVDVLPTVLSYLGIDGPTEIDGRDLLPAVRGRKLARAPAILGTAIAGYQTPPSREGERLAGIRDDGWKLVLARCNPRAALFHTASDPSETVDLGGTGRPEEAKLRSRLGEFLVRYDPGFFLCEPAAAAPPPAPVAGDLPCPEIELPVDGATLSFDDDNGTIHGRWSGRPDLHYMLEYELGEGRFHTVGRMPVDGNEKSWGPFPRGVWSSFPEFNPWRVRVTIPGQTGCDTKPVVFRFAAPEARH